MHANFAGPFPFHSKYKLIIFLFFLQKALKLILTMDSLSSLPQVKSVEESPRSPVVVDKTVEVDEPSGRQLPEDYVEETRHLAHCVQAFCQYK